MTRGFKIGSAVSLGIAGLVALLIVWIYSLKADKAQLEWDLAAKDAEIDTIWISTKYTEIDTVWRTRVWTRIDTVSGKVDTVYEDIADITGSIKIDTTKILGPDSNPMSIRVVGEFWYPKQYSNRNWLLIHPVAGTLYKPVTPRQKSWSIGLNYSRSFSQDDYFGASVRYKRFTVAPAYDPWHRTALMTVGFDIWGF